MMSMDDYHNENIYWNFNSFNNRVIKVVWFEIIHEFKMKILIEIKFSVLLSKTIWTYGEISTAKLVNLYEIYEQNVGVTGLW